MSVLPAGIAPHRLIGTRAKPLSIAPGSCGLDADLSTALTTADRTMHSFVRKPLERSSQRRRYHLGPNRDHADEQHNRDERGSFFNDGTNHVALLRYPPEANAKRT